MEPKNEIREMADELYVSEKRIANHMSRIIELAKGKIQIYEETGEPFLTELEKYSNKDKIFLVVLGMFISHQSGTISSPAISLSSIGRTLGGIPNTTLSAPIKDLVDSRILQRTENGYELNKYNTSQIISKLEELKT